MPKSRGRRPRPPRPAPPVKLPPRQDRKSEPSRGIGRPLILALRGFVPLTILIAVWVYYPRDARPFVPGLGIDVDCPQLQDVKLNAKIRDRQRYELNLSFGRFDPATCKRILLTLPPRLVGLAQMRPRMAIPTDLPIRSRNLNVFGQWVVDVETADLQGLDVVGQFDGMITDSFEKSRLLIGRAFEDADDTAHLRRVPVRLESVGVPPDFDVVDVSPTPASRPQGLGFVMLLFGNAELSELNILFLSRTWDLWKTIFNVFAVAIAMSVVAAAITALTQRPRDAPS